MSRPSAGACGIPTVSLRLNRALHPPLELLQQCQQAPHRDRRAGGGSRARAATSCPDRVMVLIATMKSQAVLREGQRPAGPRAVRRSTGARARCASWRCCADVVRSCLFEPAAVTGRTGRRSQIGGMHTAEGLIVSQKRATLTVKVSHESRVMRRCVASEAALCESENGRDRGRTACISALSQLLAVVDRKSVACSRLVYCPP